MIQNPAHPVRKTFFADATAIAIASAMALSFGTVQAQTRYTPVQWTEFVKVQGQSEPIPVQWLQDEEAKIAHSLKLPDGVPKTVPFNFWKASLTGWLPGVASAQLQYFNHLCSTEAGEWIFKKVQNVEGFYFARPQKPPTSDEMADLYGPEMPWIRRVFLLKGDSLYRQGAWFIEPPLYNYRFIEQPRRETKWQAGIIEPYIRLFGYTRGYFVKPGQVVADWNEITPMQVVGIPKPAAHYGYTWRGIKRAQDREHGIAGGELLIYDLATKEALAVRRQFLITGRNRRNGDKAAWEVAASCPKSPSNGLGGEFTQFAFDVIQTIEPSTTGKK